MADAGLGVATVPEARGRKGFNPSPVIWMVSPVCSIADFNWGRPASSDRSQQLIVGRVVL